MNFIPRMKHEAAKPAISPVTPPPKAITVSERQNFFSAKKFKMERNVFSFLDYSP
jgi:hypothetical protein